MDLICPDCGVCMEGVHANRQRCDPCSREHTLKRSRAYMRARYADPEMREKHRLEAARRYARDPEHERAIRRASYRRCKARAAANAANA